MLHYVSPVRALLVPAYSEELQTYLHLTDSLGKPLMLGKTEGRRRRGQETDSIDVNLSKLWELMMDGKLGMLQSEGAQ